MPLSPDSPRERVVPVLLPLDLSDLHDRLERPRHAHDRHQLDQRLPQPPDQGPALLRRAVLGLRGDQVEVEVLCELGVATSRDGGDP
ncbi:hypothetical protein Tdes44962_MAKER08389 [Teratosphaeria destructans]|uniref:Uncharacterized protein n=1 Tax=Teratosphaeria destructans TaxID=418781 RepID=A0A9W7SWR2_9PEZI|nr:hypothetical protein Tdes44962_MAKER08389 [Teratosphaeria destructans]